MDLSIFIAGSIAVGLVVGVLSGLLGIGGGTILIPIFKLGYSMSAVMSTATSLFTIIPTSISGMITHIRNKTCIPSLGVAAGIGGAITSPIGVWLASISPEWSIMVAAALVILYSAITMFSKAIKSLKQDKIQHTTKVAEENVSKAKSSSDPSPQSTKRQLGSEQIRDKDLLASLKTRRNIIRCAAIGLAAGTLSGYVGVGGGFIMVPLFMQLLNLPMRLTSGTSLIAVMILATSGTVLQIIYGNVNWIAGIFISIGTIPGAYIGSKLITKVPETTLRFIFSGFLIIAAALLVLNQLGVF